MGEALADGAEARRLQASTVGAGDAELRLRATYYLFTTTPEVAATAARVWQLLAL